VGDGSLGSKRTSKSSSRRNTFLEIFRCRKSDGTAGFTKLPVQFARPRVGLSAKVRKSLMA
jgi:hypothetical protein